MLKIIDGFPNYAIAEDGAVDAVKAFGGKGYGAICNCVHHKPHYNTIYSYQWEYIYEN